MADPLPSDVPPPTEPLERRSEPAAKVRGGRRWIDDPAEVAAHEWALNDLGKRIHNAREWQGWSLEKLAARSRVNAQTIADIENGRSDPNLSSITRIFRAFGRYVRVLPEPIPSGQSTQAAEVNPRGRGYEHDD